MLAIAVKKLLGDEISIRNLHGTSSALEAAHSLVKVHCPPPGELAELNLEPRLDGEGHFELYLGYFPLNFLSASISPCYTCCLLLRCAIGVLCCGFFEMEYHGVGVSVNITASGVHLREVRRKFGSTGLCGQCWFKPQASNSRLFIFRHI